MLAARSRRSRCDSRRSRSPWAAWEDSDGERERWKGLRERRGLREGDCEDDEEGGRAAAAESSG